MDNDITRERVNVALQLAPVPTSPAPAQNLGVLNRVGQSGALSGAQVER